jgi:GAF domain-containing protein
VNNRDSQILAEVARIAAEAGPALTPAGHEELLRAITSTAQTLFSAAACSLALYDEDNEELVFYVASGAGSQDVEGMRVPIDQGIAGWVATSGQPISIEDVRKDPRFAQDVAESTGYTPTSILAMPMQTERRMVGVIEVLDRTTEGRDGSRDMQMLALFAEQAALAIENSQVFTDLGRVLLEAAGRAADGSDVAEALRGAAESAPQPSRELAEIAMLLYDLSRRGPEERALAVNVLRSFLDYARSPRWPTS